MSWIGIRTERFDELVVFFNRLGLSPDIEADGFAMFKLPDEDQIEVFARGLDSHAHFTTGPVAGFLVEDIASASKELEQAGAELIGPIQSAGGNAWQHFRAPDGNVYEINQRARPGG